MDPTCYISFTFLSRDTDDTEFNTEHLHDFNKPFLYDKVILRKFIDEYGVGEILLSNFWICTGSLHYPKGIR